MTGRAVTGLARSRRLPGPGAAGLPRPALRVDLPDLHRPRWRQAEWSSFEETTIPDAVDERGSEPILVAFVADDSASFVALDPAGHRMVAGRRLAHWMQNGLPNKQDRFSVLHFCEVPQPWLRPTSPHTRKGRAQLRAMLRTMNMGGGTDICLALRKAADLVPRNWKGQVVVLLLTDGEDGSTTQELDAAVSGFPPGSVHVISIARPLPENWDGVPFGSQHVVPPLASPDEVEWIAGQAIFSAIGLSWNGPATPAGPA